MESFQVHWEKLDDAVVCKVIGYFTKDTVGQVVPPALTMLEGGAAAFVCDLSECSLVNSQGTTALMNLSLKVIDDLEQRFFLVGLNQVHRSVFSMVGFLTLVEEAETVAEALHRLREQGT